MVARPDTPDNHAPRQEIVSVIEEWGIPSNPPPPGAVAMQNHMSKMLQMVNAQLEQIAQADPCKQRDLMTMHKSVIFQLSENIRVSASKAHELRSNSAVNEVVGPSNGTRASLKSVRPKRPLGSMDLVLAKATSPPLRKMILSM
jgi:hypothetical protein